MNDVVYEAYQPTERRRKMKTTGNEGHRHHPEFTEFTCCPSQMVRLAAFGLFIEAQTNHLMEALEVYHGEYDKVMGIFYAAARTALTMTAGERVIFYSKQGDEATGYALEIMSRIMHWEPWDEREMEILEHALEAIHESAHQMVLTIGIGEANYHPMETEAGCDD